MRRASFGTVIVGGSWATLSCTQESQTNEFGISVTVFCPSRRRAANGLSESKRGGMEKEAIGGGG